LPRERGSPPLRREAPGGPMTGPQSGR
jgi:hypothetical protein